MYYGYVNITFRQLQVFEAVARNASYTRAAEELHLSQPAVSMQVKLLEDQVGLPLFEQLGKKIYLTEAGREMHRYSRAIAQQLHEAERVLAELKGVKRGRLSIAVASTANYFATRLLATFSQRYADVTISLDVTNRAGLLRHLDDNDDDLVIMGRPPQGLDLIAEPFMKNPLVIIAAPSHPLAHEQQIPMARIQHETFVVRERGSGTRNAMEQFFTDKGIEISTGMEMNSNEAIKQAVEAGLGLGIVSIHTLELELELKRLVVLNVEDFPILRHWYLVHRQGKRLSPVAQIFRNFVLNEGAQTARVPA